MLRCRGLSVAMGLGASLVSGRPGYVCLEAKEGV